MADTDVVFRGVLLHWTHGAGQLLLASLLPLCGEVRRADGAWQPDRTVRVDPGGAGELQYSIIFQSWTYKIKSLITTYDLKLFFSSGYKK